MAKPKVTEEQIREAAYHKWLADGAPEGQDQAYWFEAEAELGAPKPKKAPARKPAAKKPAAKTTGKTATAKKPAAKVATAKKPAAKKTSAKKTTGKAAG